VYDNVDVIDGRYEAAQMIRWNPNIYFDLAGSGSWQRMDVHKLQDVFAPWSLDEIGVGKAFEKMIYGSDAIVGTSLSLLEECLEGHRRIFDDLGIPEHIRRKALRENFLSVIS